MVRHSAEPKGGTTLRVWDYDEDWEVSEPALEVDTWEELRVVMSGSKKYRSRVHIQVQGEQPSLDDDFVDLLLSGFLPSFAAKIHFRSTRNSITPLKPAPRRAPRPAICASCNTNRIYELKPEGYEGDVFIDAVEITVLGRNKLAQAANRLEEAAKHDIIDDVPSVDLDVIGAHNLPLLHNGKVDRVALPCGSIYHASLRP